MLAAIFSKENNYDKLTESFLEELEINTKIKLDKIELRLADLYDITKIEIDNNLCGLIAYSMERKTNKNCQVGINDARNIHIHILDIWIKKLRIDSKALLQISCEKIKDELYSELGLKDSDISRNTQNLLKMEKFKKMYSFLKNLIDLFINMIKNNLNGYIIQLKKYSVLQIEQQINKII